MVCVAVAIPLYRKERIERRDFMPTKNKRVNLTIPDVLYEKIQEFKEENGITSDASACIQLINAQLRSLENTKVLLQTMKKLTPEQLEQMSQEGFQTMQEAGLLSPKED